MHSAYNLGINFVPIWKEIDVDSKLLYVWTINKFYIFDLEDSSYLLEQDILAHVDWLERPFDTDTCKGTYVKAIDKIYVADRYNMCHFTPTNISTFTCDFGYEYTMQRAQGVTAYGDHVYYRGYYFDKGSGLFHAPVGRSNLNQGTLVYDTLSEFTDFSIPEEDISLAFQGGAYIKVEYSEYSQRLLKEAVFYGNDTYSGVVRKSKGIYIVYTHI